ncbi:MAG: hypothetical protein R3E87_12175 [Burkholderiaceae bacterium]
MSRILLLTHRLPLPPNRGDKIRSYHLLRHLTRGTKLRWPARSMMRDLAHLPALAEICEQVLSVRIDGGLAKLRWPQAFVRGEAISAVHFHNAPNCRRRSTTCSTGRRSMRCSAGAPMANYVFRSRHRERLLSQTTLLADLIDVDSEVGRLCGLGAPAGFLGVSARVGAVGPTGGGDRRALR